MSHVCHKLRTRKEGTCPKLSKYQQSSWKTIDLNFSIKFAKRLFSAICDHFSGTDASVLTLCSHGAGYASVAS